MSTFPLYDILIKDAVDVDLTYEQKKEIIEVIPLLDNTEHENLYAVIRFHTLSTKTNEAFNVPYDGKKISTNMYSNNTFDVKFDLDKFPNIMKQMVYNFIQLYKNAKTQ